MYSERFTGQPDAFPQSECYRRGYGSLI